MRHCRSVVVAAMLIMLVASWPGLAEPLNVDQGRLAIKGYDPVAYFTLNRPTPGASEFTYEWQGTRWQFVNAEHRELFAGDPRRYAPRYGGFCAGAMTRGVRADVDPEAWLIVDGRLYLNFSKEGRDRFAADADAKVRAADAHWERVRLED